MGIDIACRTLRSPKPFTVVNISKNSLSDSARNPISFGKRLPIPNTAFNVIPGEKHDGISRRMCSGLVCRSVPAAYLLRNKFGIFDRYINAGNTVNRTIDLSNHFTLLCSSIHTRPGYNQTPCRQRCRIRFCILHGITYGLKRLHGTGRQRSHRKHPTVVGIFSRLSTFLTMSRICSFVACPFPVSDFLILLAPYEIMPMFWCPAARSTTPLACPIMIEVRGCL